METFPAPILQRPFQWAVVASVAFHGAMLASGWLRLPAPPPMGRYAGPLEVRLVSPAPALSAAREAAVAQAVSVPVPRSTPTLPAQKDVLQPAAESPATVVASGAAQASAAPAGETALVPPQFAVAYLNNPPPAYPSFARRMGLEGDAYFKVKVSTAGLPLEIQLARSSGHDVLDDAARSAVQRWRFVPARQGTQPVEAWVVVPVKFRLTGADAPS